MFCKYGSTLIYFFQAERADLWCASLRTELDTLNLQVSGLRLDAAMGVDKEKVTYFELYKTLHMKYVHVKAKRAEEWTTREILLHEERKKVRYDSKTVELHVFQRE